MLYPFQPAARKNAVSAAADFNSHVSATGAVSSNVFPKPENQPPPFDVEPKFWLRPPWSFLVALLLIVLTTFALISLNHAVAAEEPGVYVRPYTGLYLFPLLLLTWAGGRTLGLFTLITCLLTTMYFLLPPVGWGVSHPSDWVGIAFFTVTNTVVVLGLDALQHKAALVAAATTAQQDSARFLQEALEVQARLQSIAETTQEQRQGQLLPQLLLPELPPQLPGLDLRVHYEALLKAGDLGTPFFDSFVVSRNRTALVVGTVAGSGLTATSSVAMTRSMLRSAVYRHASLVDAVTELNALLASHHLLAGPSRLFVGLYDASAMTLSSVSCGQMPTLARRTATGTIEELADAGPLLGKAEGSVYQERTQTLAPGDILLLSPGNEREGGETLDVSCWKRVLEKPLTGQDAQQMIEQLVQRGKAECPPDQEESLCLLVAVATGAL